MILHLKRLALPCLASALSLSLLAPAGCAQAPASPARASAASASTSGGQTATGIVYDDQNRNRKRDTNEKGIANIRVSNGREIVRTDASGRYRLGVDDDTILFVIKPRGWMTPLSADKLPQFHYVHKPKGSPRGLKYEGVAPTGPLPASVDFALHRQSEPDKFRVLVFGDPQPRNEKEVDWIGHDVVEELIGAPGAFGVSLGDIAFNNLDVYPSLNAKISLIGLPWYNIIGNHDLNFESPDDKHSDETWERVFGPPYYSFDYGPVHFIALDDVLWKGGVGGEKGYYEGGLDEEQMQFIRNDLAQIPADQMVVLMMHIPLADPADYNKAPAPGERQRFHDAHRRELYGLLAKRPFSLSLSAHTHFQEHKFVEAKDGFARPEKHHHAIMATVCGSWWSGSPDERGIPHTTMRDGTPNGYTWLNFDGAKYSMEFKAAGRPADYQMNIYAPDEVLARESGATEVLVNVFAGSERSRVEMQLGEGAWLPMARTPRPDPAYAALKEIEAQADAEDAPEVTRTQNAGGRRARKKKQPSVLPGRRLPGIIDSPHIWAAKLPANAAPGTHLLRVRTTDMWGKTYTDKRIVRILPNP